MTFAKIDNITAKLRAKIAAKFRENSTDIANEFDGELQMQNRGALTAQKRNSLSVLLWNLPEENERLGIPD